MIEKYPEDENVQRMVEVNTVARKREKIVQSNIKQVHNFRQQSRERQNRFDLEEKAKQITANMKRLEVEQRERDLLHDKAEKWVKFREKRHSVIKRFVKVKKTVTRNQIYDPADSGPSPL